MQNLSLYKTPPQNIDAEKSIISSILFNNNCLDDVMEVLQPEDFYKTKHQNIFYAIKLLYEKSEPVDLPVLSDKLKEIKKLAEIGGAVYLASIIDEPIAVDPIYTSELIKEKFRKRKILEITSKAMNLCFEDSSKSDEILNDTEHKLMAIETGKAKQTITIGKAVDDSIDRLEKIQDSKKITTGISSGITAIDSMTSGFQDSDLILLAARPSMGKTSLALNIADNIIMDGDNVLFYSLEMPYIQLANKMLAKYSQINTRNFMSGKFNTEQWERITEAAGKIFDKNLYINDNPTCHYADILREARKYKKDHDLNLIIVDYIQLMDGDKGESREKEVSSISKGLKRIARELNIPVIGLSQLNRGLEQRKDKRPMLSDLRESGSLEQDADIVMFLYRDEIYKENSQDAGIAELNFAKYRNGPTGTIKLKFSKELTLFSNLYDREII